MTIRIEVTGDSLPEVADKLLALGSSLRSQAIYDADNAAREALQEKRTARTKAKKAIEEAQPETKQEDAGNPSASADTEASSSPASSQDSGDEKSDSGQTAPADASPSDAPELDFDKEVAPVVIDAVQRLGKPAVSALLSEFGVERASEVDPSLYGELVERLKAL